MKIGDVLYCHTTCILDNGITSISKSKIYRISYIDNDYLGVIDDSGYEHLFSLPDTYKTWLILLNEERKNKLNKLNLLY